MHKHDTCEPAITDLGKASVETKGTAIFDSDGSGGRLNYVMGLAHD